MSREEVQQELANMEARDYQALKDDLRSLERRSRGLASSRLGRVSKGAYTRDDPGSPLGKGFPTGSSLRQGSESHREAWSRIMRADPCSYCGREAGTVDHVEPRRGARAPRGLGGANVWLNLVGACEACNSAKGSTSLLEFIGRRAGIVFPKAPTLAHQKSTRQPVGNSVAKQKRFAALPPEKSWVEAELARELGREGEKSRAARRAA